MRRNARLQETASEIEPWPLLKIKKCVLVVIINVYIFNGIFRLSVSF